MPTGQEGSITQVFGTIFLGLFIAKVAESLEVFGNHFFGGIL